MEEITGKGLEYVEIKTPADAKASYVLSDKLNISNFKVLNNGSIRVYENQITSQKIMKVLAENDIEIQAVNVQSETLEDYFLKVTGGESECGN